MKFEKYDPSLPRPVTGGSELPFPEGGLDAFIARPNEQTLACLRKYQGDFLVLGAAGKMGLHLCMMLQAGLRSNGSAGRVFAVSRFRSVSGIELFEQQGIRAFSGDLCDPVFVDTLPDCPNVFYLVGSKFGTSVNPGLLEEINVKLPRSLGERFRAARIVALSTGCVYPYVRPEGGGSIETSVLEANGDYAESCIGRERSFEEVSQRHGTAVALVRLNYSVELRYGVLLDIAQKVWRGEAVSIEMAWVNVIWQGDALNLIIQCIEYADTPPRAINVTGRDLLRVREIAEGFARRLGKEARFEGSEQDKAWLSNVDWACSHLSPPEVGLEQIMDWVAIWVKEGRETYGKPTGFERRDGKY